MIAEEHAHGPALPGLRHPRAGQQRRGRVPARAQHARHPVDLLGQRRPLRPTGGPAPHRLPPQRSLTPTTPSACTTSRRPTSTRCPSSISPSARPMPTAGTAGSSTCCATVPDGHRARARRARRRSAALVADLERYMELARETPDRRAALPVPRRLRPHDPLREGPRRARAGGAERQQVLHSRQGRLRRAPVRQRARVRQPPRRADRRGRRSRGGRGGQRTRPPCTCSPCTRPRASSGRWCSS